MQESVSARSPASAAGSGLSRQNQLRQVNFKLIAQGLTPFEDGDGEFTGIARNFLEGFREKARLLSEYRCPADRRIEDYLQAHFADLALPWKPRLPAPTLVLDEAGLARQLSLPAEGDKFTSPLLESYRIRNGVLNNPKSDRRTTEGTFHVAEGGLPVPGNKKSVPKCVFAELFRHAVSPPDDLLTLPFTSDLADKPGTFVSLLLRPIVCPEVSGVCLEKTMEVRFFAPGSLVSNLDFVEMIFGNGGDPFLPRNDAGLDVEHWTGHTGCVILAPHLANLTKKELGLPNIADATERQKRDRMCWKSESEKYNDGIPFKITCRTAAGVIVTILADNYYGYCKKEVKTQISFAANLYGNVEEEHSGGALAFTGYSFGDEYQTDSRRVNGRTFEDVQRDYADIMTLQPEGYGVDKKFPNLLYIPHDARASVARQEMWWTRDGKEIAIPLSPGKIYMTPSGFKVRIEKHPGAPSWRIIGTVGEGTNCHKPCTVSGGGKSEISKSLRDGMIYGPIFVSDLDVDFNLVDEIFKKDYSTRWTPDAEGKPDYATHKTRSLLSPERSLGSVIKLLTPSAEYTDEYNNWLASIPNYVYPIVFIIKRFYRPEWGDDWRSHFGVDIVNGFPGHELKYHDRKLVGTYLRVGLGASNAWRTYKVRQDFAAADKVQTEDDITASIVVSTDRLSKLRLDTTGDSRKFSVNCEDRLFQRPDEAIHRGFDKQTEADMARDDNFISNFQPLTAADAREMVAKVTEYDRFTQPMQDLLRDAASLATGYVVCSANPRLIDGKPSKNPRYLQLRPDLVDPLAKYVAEQGMRLFRAVPADKPVYMPVDAVLIGRRNNPAEPAAHIRGLSVYNPIHYQELPELFMDFICSLTGKSPSTTGAGSEGALTKGPFNALRPIIDLNNALVSYILTGLGGFSTAAGHIGPGVRVDHDISLLVPEVWCRLSPQERSPEHLISNGYLEPLKDFWHDGRMVHASRLGYRITERFVRAYFGRIFDNPSKVFDASILHPELQNWNEFADGILNITEAQKRVAQEYLDDNSINDACPPLRALLMIMATGTFEGMDAHHARIRAMFKIENLINSDWYQQRLIAKQKRDVATWKRYLNYLDAFCAQPHNLHAAARLNLTERRQYVQDELTRAASPEYLKSLQGTLGCDPSTAAKS
jgi:hypothetical protein